MSKIFGLLACIGTAAMVSGCVKVSQPKTYQPKSSDQIMQDIMNEPKNAKLKRSLEFIKENTSCNKREANQKISEAAEANTVNSEIVAEVQDVNVINAQCSGKDVLNEKVVFQASSSVVITGAQSADPIVKVEIESDRTCAKLEATEVVADVTQAVNKEALLIEADGDLQLPITNSLWKLPISMNVADGKNLLKVKYFKCDGWIESFPPGGTPVQVCAKHTQVAEKELVLNVLITKNVIEGVRTSEGCPKKEEQPKTDGQE